MKRPALFLVLATLALSVLAQQKHVLAGIEIGGSGIKCQALEVTDRGEFYTVKKIYSRQINVQLAAGMKDEVLLDERIKKAAEAAAELKDELKKKDPEFLFVAASTAFEQARNKDALAEAVKKATFQELDFIRTEDEVHYGMTANIPKARLKYSVLLDVGGKNMKMGYETPLARNGFEAVAFDYGSKSLEEAARNGGEGALRRILLTEVAPRVKEATSDRPGLTSGSRPIYIIGGASWAAATLAKPNEVGRPSVTLTLADLQALYAKIEPMDKNIHSSGVLPSKLSDAATNMIRGVEDAFPPDRLRAGVGLLVTTLENMGASGGRPIIFPAETAEGGWMYGYMFGKFNTAQEAAGEKPKKTVKTGG